MVFSKEEGILLAFYQRANEVIKMYSEGFQLCFKLYVLHVWSLVERLLKKVLFPYFFLCYFHIILVLAWVTAEVIVFDARNSSLIIFLFLLSTSWTTLFIRNVFSLIYFLCTCAYIPKHRLRSMVFSACINKLKRKI